MKHQDTFTLWGVQEPNSGHVLDTYATREIARNACGKRYKPVKLECRIVPQYPKKPKKPKTFTSHGLKWIPHTPGDPMPCPPDTLVRVLFADIDPSTSGTLAYMLNWRCNNNAADIIGWHPVEEQPSLARRVLDLLEAGDIEQAKHELRKELE